MYSVTYESKANSETNSKSLISSKPPLHRNNKFNSGSDDSTLHLQGTLGDQDVQGFVLKEPSKGFDFAKIGIHPKMKVSQPDDPYEQEADRVAEQVMRMDAGVVQRKCSKCQMESEKKYADLSISRKHANNHHLETDDRISGEINTVRSSSGQPLDSSTRSFMEPRFRYNFSNVRIHDDSSSQQLARSINARAFTVGNNIFLGSNEHASNKTLMAHELVHVIQQSNSPYVQRLIRTPYPWQGVATSDVTVYNIPNVSNPTEELGTILQGEMVQVISNDESSLLVETPTLRGYVFEGYIDDATSASMGASVGTRMVWNPSGPGSGTDFERWASASSETTFTVTSSTVMNCWEAVLFTAYRSGSLTWRWIHDLYVNIPPTRWVGTMSRGPLTTYRIPGPTPQPQRGDIVFFNGLAHVALATGTMSEVYTFWPPPDTPFVMGGSPDRVKVFTIEDLVNWWESNMPPAPLVQFGAPRW